MFNVHIQSKWCSARLSGAQVPAVFGFFVWDRKKGGEGVRGGGMPVLVGTREYEQSDRNQ